MTAEAATAEQVTLNLYPVPKTPNKMAIISPMLDRALSLQVVTKEDVDVARAFGKEINAMIKVVVEDFRPTKQAIDASKKVVLQQENNHLEPLEKAKTIVSQKIGAWDTAERNRIAEEARLRQQEEERRRQAALETARKKLDTLMAGMTENQGAVKTLENMLGNPATTAEEAEIIRSQIRTLQSKIESTIERAQAVEMKVEEVNQPVLQPDVINIKTATGVNQEKAITGIKTRLLVKYLASPDCTLDPESIVKWNEGQIKKLINSGMNLPGVAWEYRSKTRF